MKYYDQLKTPQWQKKRLEILQRDNFKCRSCKNKTKQLNVHHIYYESGFKIWEYDNESLITLCKNCHTEIHELNKIISIIATKIIDEDIDIIEFSEYINKYKNNEKHTNRIL